MNPMKQVKKMDGQIVTEMLGLPNQARIERGGVPDVSAGKTEFIFDYGNAKYTITTGVNTKYTNHAVWGRVVSSYAPDNKITFVQKQ